MTDEIRKAMLDLREALLTVFPNGEQYQRFLLHIDNGDYSGVAAERRSGADLLEKVRNDKKIQKIVKKLAASFLVMVNPGLPLGTDLYNIIAENSWSVSFECVAIRRNKKTRKIQVFLAKRANNDSAYPGQLHCPGTIYRPNDTELTTLERLKKTEGIGVAAYQFVNDVIFNDERGPIIARVYLVESPTKKTESGKWHNWESVESNANVVAGHREQIIPAAVEAFLKREKKRKKK